MKCLRSDPLIDDHTVLQAIRKSLRGTARQTLIPLGETATSTDVFNKLETLFGNVVSHESVMQKFYTEVQHEKESVTLFGCRLESLLQIAVDSGHVSPSSKNDMLCSKFWTGLRDERLKNQTRYKFDTIKNFDLLLREMRAVEVELNTSDKNRVPVQHQPVQVPSVDNSKLDKLTKQMNDMMEKLRALELKVDKANSVQDTISNTTNDHSFSGGRGRGNYGTSGPRSYHNEFTPDNRGAVGRSGYRGYYRGRGRSRNFSYRDRSNAQSKE